MSENDRIEPVLQRPTEGRPEASSKPLPQQVSPKKPRRRSVVLRVVLGSIVLAIGALVVSLQTLMDLSDRRSSDTFLDRLESVADGLSSDQPLMAAHARNAIYEAQLLRDVGVARDIRTETAVRALQSTAQPVFDEEVPSQATQNIARLGCAEDALDCRDQYWAVDSPSEDIATFEETPASFLQEVVVEGLGLESCAFVEEIRTAADAGSPPPRRDPDDGELPTWLQPAEACRFDLEQALRATDDNLQALFQDIEQTRDDIIVIRQRYSSIEVTPYLLRLADEWNPLVQSYAEAVARRDAICHAARVLAATYLYRSADRMVVRNRSDATAIIAAALSLAECSYIASARNLSYMWPFVPPPPTTDPSSPGNAPPTRRDIQNAVAEWEEQGFTVLETRCLEQIDDNVDCEPAEEGDNLACFGYQLLFHPGEDEIGDEALHFAVVDPRRADPLSIFAVAGVDTVLRLDRDNQPLDITDVTGLLCNREPIFDANGFTTLGVLLHAEPNRPLYMNQRSDNRLRWQASSDPSFAR